MANKTIYVTGHKNPDADSIISAMAYAYFKQQLGYDAVAVRIGELNQETEYILSLFKEFAPPLAKDIRTCVRDIDFDDVITCAPNDSFKDVLSKMNNAHKKVIAVLDDEKTLLGMATISDITAPLVGRSDKCAQLIKDTPVEKIIEQLRARVVYISEKSHSNGRVHILASEGDNDCSDCIVVTASDPLMHRQAVLCDAAILIATNTYAFTEEVKQLAKEHNCTLLICKGDIFTIAQQIYFACSIKQIMSTELTCFQYDDYIDDVKQAINKSRFRSYPVIDSKGHIIGTLSRYHVFKHANRNLILVDHNELSQSIEGAADANIMEIIDHHRIGGLVTSSPVYFRNEQVGCCSTIISKIFRENNIAIPPYLAGLMCCAIISDTVNFKSVTCTQQDIDEAALLAMNAGINLATLGPKILTAGARLSNKSAHELFHKDMKQFTVNSMKVCVGQTNTVSLEEIEPLRDNMKKVLADYATDSSSALVVMAFTLIDGSGSYILYSGPESKKIVKALTDKVPIDKGFTFLKGFISRKQQLIPLLTEALQ